MLLRWILRLEKRALITGLLLYLISYPIQNYSVVVSTLMMENGATTISQECLPRWQRKIDVTEVFLVCDHQNAGDDQSGDNNDDSISYTNRPWCMMGDLGKVGIGFTLRNDLPYNTTVYMSMQTQYHGRSATIRNRTDICSYSNFGYIDERDGTFYSPSFHDDDDNQNEDDENSDSSSSSSSSSLCPIKTGVHYMLLTSFTVQESSSRKSNWEFTPDLSMLFFLSDDESSPLVGCVETGTKAQQALDRQRARDGVVALISSIFLFVIVFAYCLHNQGQQKRAVNMLENNRAATMIRRYHYRRDTSSRSGSMMGEGVGNHPYVASGGDGFIDFAQDKTIRTSSTSRPPPPPWANAAT